MPERYVPEMCKVSSRFSTFETSDFLGQTPHPLRLSRNPQTNPVKLN